MPRSAAAEGSNAPIGVDNEGLLAVMEKRDLLQLDDTQIGEAFPSSDHLRDLVLAARDQLRVFKSDKEHAESQLRVCGGESIHAE